MADYGFALIVKDSALVPVPGALDAVETSLRALHVIGDRLPQEHPDSAVVKWAPGPAAGDYIRGNPEAISVYVGEPTPFFDGGSVMDTSFLLKTMNADPSGLVPVLEGALGVRLTVHPFRL